MVSHRCFVFLTWEYAKIIYLYFNLPGKHKDSQFYLTMYYGHLTEYAISLLQRLLNRLLIAAKKIKR